MVVDGSSLVGSKIACANAVAAFSEEGEGGGARLFFQKSTGDIVEYSRNTLEEQWSVTTLPTT